MALAASVLDEIAQPLNDGIRPYKLIACFLSDAQRLFVARSGAKILEDREIVGGAGQRLFQFMGQG